MRLSLLALICLSVPLYGVTIEQTIEDENGTRTRRFEVDDTCYAIVVETNRHRARNGLRKLFCCPSLSRTAQEQARWMHRNRSMTHRYAPENIAMGYGSPQSTVRGWMNSSGHRANILNRRYTRIGAGWSGGWSAQHFR